MHNRTRYLTPLVLAATLMAACSSNGDSSSPPPAKTGTAVIETPADETNTPPLPGSLPKFTDSGDVAQAMQQLIQLALQHAAGISDQDRHPTVTVTDGSICGVKVAASTCPVSSASAPVPIIINPTVAWQNYQQDPGHGGGDAPWQNAVLGSVINYLMFRHTQRADPSLLTSTGDANAPKVRTIQLCKTGNVAGPLRSVMSPELEAMYAPYDKYGDYVLGTKGKC